MTLSEDVRSWFGRSATMLRAPAAADLHPAEPASAVGPLSAWSAERLALADSLWGAGYVIPGGEIEILRLAKPLGLSAASSLLLLGAGAGGAACSLATKLGVWVSGFESDADLVAAAARHLSQAKLGRRAQIQTWNPAEPGFSRQYYHHCLALEPLQGSKPEPTLAAVALALKPGGQVMLLELVADTPFGATDAVAARWASLERRDLAALPSEVAITRVLGRLGFDVRIVEDVSQRHMEQALLGWRTTVRSMEYARPSVRNASLVVREAELWLLRLRLFRSGRLRLVRWHAIGRPGC
ncbi:MAG TPA: hypothetical protein VIG49_11275 [Acetobacteraceae bacterium]|jgi:cyclopropane fatty-acyl-phospholipid synthase-like methyltransferase